MKPVTQTLLVIDDHLEMGEFIRDALRPFFWSVLMAENAREGIQMARHLRPRVILVDLWLKGSDVSGLDLIRLFRADPLTEKATILAISATDVDNMMNQSIAAGCDDFMVKPFSVQELRNKLDVLLA